MFGARVVRQKRERERAERGLLDADSRPTVPYIKVDTIATSASKSSIRRFVITEKAPTSTFSWLWTQFHVERPWGQRPFSIVS